MTECPPWREQGDTMAPSRETLLWRRVRPLTCQKMLISFNLSKPAIRTTRSQIWSLLGWSGCVSCHSYHCHAGKETDSFLRKCLGASCSDCHLVLSYPDLFPEPNQHVEGVTGIHSETHFSTRCFPALLWFSSSDGQPLVTDQGKTLSSLHLLKSPVQ